MIGRLSPALVPVPAALADLRRQHPGTYKVYFEVTGAGMPRPVRLRAGRQSWI